MEALSRESHSGVSRRCGTAAGIAAAWIGAEGFTLYACTEVVEAIEVAVDPSLVAGLAVIVNHIPLGAVVHKECLSQDGGHVGATGDYGPTVLFYATVGASELLYQCCLYLAGEVAGVTAGPVVPGFGTMSTAVEGIEVDGAEDVGVIADGCRATCRQGHEIVACTSQTISTAIGTEPIFDSVGATKSQFAFVRGAGTGSTGVTTAVSGVEHNFISAPRGFCADGRDYCHGKYREKCRYFLHGSILFEVSDVDLTVGVRNKCNFVSVRRNGRIHLDAVARGGESLFGTAVDIEHIELAGKVAVTVVGGTLVYDLAVADPLGAETDAEDTFAGAVKIDDYDVVHFVEHDLLAVGRELGVERGAAVEQALVAIGSQDIEIVEVFHEGYFRHGVKRLNLLGHSHSLCRYSGKAVCNGLGFADDTLFARGCVRPHGGRHLFEVFRHAHFDAIGYFDSPSSVYTLAGAVGFGEPTSVANKELAAVGAPTEAVAYAVVCRNFFNVFAVSLHDV